MTVPHRPFHRLGCRTLLSLTSLLLGALGAPVALAAQNHFGDPVRGQDLFVDKGCVQCHAVRGAGGRTGPDLGRTQAKGSFFEIATGLWNHSVTMQEKMKELRVPRPRFSDDELADLVAFIYFLNYFDEPGDIRQGKILFTEKHCIQCHRVGEEGGNLGPRLDDLPRSISPLVIAQGLWNHGPEMVRSMRRRNLEVPQFQGEEILDLFAYLRSQGRRRAPREFQSPGDPERGQRLFENKGCARCHGVFDSESGIGPDLGRTELRGSVTQIAGRMWNHWPAMADAMEALDMPLPTFDEDDLADLLAYLFLARYDGQTASAENGRLVYREKGCVACHGPEGRGGIGPSLRTRTTGMSKEAITQGMWNHAPAMEHEMDRNQIPWPRFETQEMADLLTFLTRGWEEVRAQGETHRKSE